MYLLKLSTFSLGIVLALFPDVVVANPPAEPTFDITTRIRFRYEYVDTQLPTTNNSDGVVVSRISTRATYNTEYLGFDAELMDSRIFGDNEHTPVGTDDTNALEPVQFNLSWRSTLNTANSSQLAIKVGRFTMDVGSRRLVARNRFRNTLNTFDGIKFDVNLASLSITAFYTHPVTRQPMQNNRTLPNDIQLDGSSPDYRFFGFHTDVPIQNGNMQFYVFQDERALSQTRRNTIGHLANIMLSKRFSIDYEAAIQRGEHESSKVRASFLHIALSANVNAATLRLFHDVATGDDVSTESFEGFSTLFGARRFEYGPTGIFGVFARNNMTSLGVSSNFHINESSQLFVQVRTFDIHESGVSGRLNGQLLDRRDYLGTMSELRLRTQINDVMYLESGLAAARLNQEIAVNKRIMHYAYLQTSYTF